MREITFIQFLKRHPNPVDAHSPKVGVVYRVLDFHGDHTEEWEDDEGDYQETYWEAIMVERDFGHGPMIDAIVKADDMEYNKFTIEVDEDCPLFKEAI